MSTPEEQLAAPPKEPPDLEKLPNFNALVAWLHQQQQTGVSVPAMLPSLHTWIEKLQDWCEAAMAAGEQDSNRIEELVGQVNSLEQAMQEAEWWEDTAKEGMEIIEDFERGVRDQTEVVAWMRDNKPNEEATSVSDR